jgi:glycerophosphoryl diester phosphodiesterase
MLIAHRGFPGLRLEHTRPSYDLAIDSGADYIEPDIVATKDGHLVVRHEHEISHTTDVADRPEFADRHTTKTIEGKQDAGWFAEDFTLAELKTLHCRERIADIRPHNADLTGEILTLDEVIAIAAEGTVRRGRPVGIYIETKHPSYFESIGLNLNDLLLDALERHQLNRPDAPVIIQSFESGNLRDLRRRTELPLVRLVMPRKKEDLDDLDDIATFADIIGPHKDLVIPRNSDGRLAEPTTLVDRAHEAGLRVHIWTMRDEPSFLPAGMSSHEEYAAFFAAGIDGFFTDWTTTAVESRAAWLAAHQAPSG